MPYSDNVPCWFLGANAPKGYYSKFDQLFSASPGGKCFLLKGGPGTGKSTVLKKIAETLQKRKLSTELIFCTADTDSLDAVIASEGKIVAADATPPHGVHPKYPGIYEREICFSDFWNEEKLLEHAKEISGLFDENRRLHEEARRYISAAANLLEEAEKLEASSISYEKTVKTAKRICLREFGKKYPRQGTEKLRFLSAITDKGIFFFRKTPEILCSRVYIVNDDAGAVSKIFMSTVRKIALEHGFDIITCRCPVFPSEKIEHIFIPALRLGFMTDNKRHKIETKAYRTIHARRFFDSKKYPLHKLKIRFSLRLAKDLFEKAADCMKEAKTVHHKLESFYVSAMDFSLAEKKLSEILEKL